MRRRDVASVGRGTVTQFERCCSGSAVQQLAQHRVERADLADVFVVFVRMLDLDSARGVLAGLVRLMPKLVRERRVLRGQQQRAEQSD